MPIHTTAWIIPRWEVLIWLVSHHLESKLPKCILHALLIRDIWAHI